jgi:hypothetical protein
MENHKCAICGTENLEIEIECTRCHWPISADSDEIKGEKIVKWANQIYKAWSKIYKSEQLKKQNPTIEDSLQSLVSFQESQIKLLQEQNNIFKRLFTEVACIREQFPANNSVTFNQAQNLEPTEEDLYIQSSVFNRTSVSNYDIQQLNHYSEYSQFVEYYNQKAEIQEKIEISETAESKSQRMDSFQSSPIFERKNRGDYWLINNRYLVPKHNHKINPHSYQTFSTLFECKNYDQSGKDNFILIKPGKVNCLNNQEIWQLEERGVIEFL